MKRYEDYLQSDWWRGFRARYKRSHVYQCAANGCKTAYRLQLHHLRYEDEQGSILGRETYSDVCWLCDFHHGQVSPVDGRPPRYVLTNVYRKGKRID